MLGLSLVNKVHQKDPTAMLVHQVELHQTNTDQYSWVKNKDFSILIDSHFYETTSILESSVVPQFNRSSVLTICATSHYWKTQILKK